MSKGSQFWKLIQKKYTQKFNVKSDRHVCKCEDCDLPFMKRILRKKRTVRGENILGYIEGSDLKDELIAERKVGYFDKPTDMSDLTYKIIINIDKFSLMIGRIVSWITVPLFLCMAFETFATASL